MNRLVPIRPGVHEAITISGMAVSRMALERLEFLAPER